MDQALREALAAETRAIEGLVFRIELERATTERNKEVWALKAQIARNRSHIAVLDTDLAHLEAYGVPAP